MDINLIKKLIKVVEQSEVTELAVEEGDLKIKISKNSNQQPHFNIQPGPNFQYGAPAAAAHQAGGELTPAASVSHESPKSNIHEIRSPIVGTFYRAPAPDADPYIQVGDLVSAGSVLCIVEAMKLMNEIESDATGKIVKILVENATPVEYNQPLFLIETA